MEARGMDERCTIIRGDFFDYDFPRAAYDSVLVGFFLSHVTDAQEALVFATLARLLVPSGRFLILDSCWSEERAQVNAKIERQERALNDGTRFEIYKRYFDRHDIGGWAHRYGVSLSVEHFGTAFVAVSGSFTDGTAAGARDHRNLTQCSPADQD